ncbi:hypothetical protein [Thermococcus sp.]
MDDLRELVEEALFEARPYVEYYDRLRDEIMPLLKAVSDVEELRLRIEEIGRGAGEPFRTDIRIFLQKLDSLAGS